MPKLYIPNDMIALLGDDLSKETLEQMIMKIVKSRLWEDSILYGNHMSRWLKGREPKQQDLFSDIPTLEPKKRRRK